MPVETADPLTINSRPMSFAGPGAELAFFAYGSDMHPEQIARRCGAAEFAGAAVLYGFRMAFFGHDGLWDSGRETLVPQPGGQVWGAIYRLGLSDKDRLDLWHDARLDGNGASYHYPAWVFTPDGRRLPVCFYRASAPEEPAQPSVEYRRYLCEAAALRGLPVGYVDQLRAVAARPAAYPVPKRSRFNPADWLPADCSSCGCGDGHA